MRAASSSPRPGGYNGGYGYAGGVDGSAGVGGGLERSNYRPATPNSRYVGEDSEGGGGEVEKEESR